MTSHRRYRKGCWAAQLPARRSPVLRRPSTRPVKSSGTSVAIAWGVLSGEEKILSSRRLLFATRGLSYHVRWLLWRTREADKRSHFHEFCIVAPDEVSRLETVHEPFGGSL